ncbi:unnamed protein product [Oppiella nova]|uniref:Peptidase M24 domain-containing protein n=1 Tax=Oppiella nova TaxID=334625 RepID=A0A7R9Q903_9ACAR|nr:unnamed protein product [Oppiella nova]CAG2159483.1 unnamed protein product [Oppiella nova]
MFKVDDVNTVTRTKNVLTHFWVPEASLVTKVRASLKKFGLGLHMSAFSTLSGTQSRLAAEVLDMIKPHIKPGVSTLELDTICHDYIVNKQDAIPACLGYGAAPGRPAFQHVICTSVNHVVCHDGYHGDTNMMYVVGGETSIIAERLCKVAQEAMYRGMETVKPGSTIGDIGAAIQKYVESERFSVVREYCGHGMVLEEGMTFTIEPMVNAGVWQTRLMGDKWTVVTKDHSLSAQYEHTLLVTKDGWLHAMPQGNANPIKVNTAVAEGTQSKVGDISKKAVLDAAVKESNPFLYGAIGLLGDTIPGALTGTATVNGLSSWTSEGTGLTAKDVDTFGLMGNYYFTDNLSLEFKAGVPPKVEIEGKGQIYAPLTVCGFQVVFLGIHLPGYLIDHGFDASTGTIFLALVGLFNIIGTYTAGWLGGKYSKPHLLMGLYGLRGIAIIAFLMLPLSIWTVYAFGIVMGILWLSTVPLTNGIVANMFGVKYLTMLSGTTRNFDQIDPCCINGFKYLNHFFFCDSTTLEICRVHQFGKITFSFNYNNTWLILRTEINHHIPRNGTTQAAFPPSII